MLSPSGSKVYATYAVRLSPWPIQTRKSWFGGQGLLAEAHTAKLGNSAAVSPLTVTMWQRKALGTPRNHAHHLRFYFYLLAKEVPHQIHKYN